MTDQLTAKLFLAEVAHVTGNFSDIPTGKGSLLSIELQREYLFI